MPRGGSARGKGIRLPAGEIQAGLPLPGPAISSSSWEEERAVLRKVRLGLAALQADRAPASGCEAANAVARMCARLGFEADPE